MVGSNSYPEDHFIWRQLLFVNSHNHGSEKRRLENALDVSRAQGM